MALLILTALLALLFLGLRLLYDRRWDRGLDCALTFLSEYGVEGETARLQEVVVNDKHLPLPVVEIDFHMDRRLQFTDRRNTAVSDKSYRRDVFALGPRQKITRTLDFQCAGRGYFVMEQAGITAQDLFLTRKYLADRPQRTEFYVLPRPVPAAKVEIPYARIMGAVLSRKRVYDDPFEFAGLREYTRSDPLKYVNWKATARAGKLLTNLHESTLSQRILVLLDEETLGHPQTQQLAEGAVRIAGSLCRRLLAAGVELSLLSNGRDAQTGQPWRVDKAAGGGSVLFLWKKLACLETGDHLPPICSLAPDDPSEERLLVLITARPRQDLAEEFSRLAGKGQGVEIIAYSGERPPLDAPRNVDVLWVEA